MIQPIAYLFSLLLLCGARAAEPIDLHHGVGIHFAMNWAPMEPGADRRYKFPPFADEAHRLTNEQLTIIRAAGFDFVRLTVDPGPFLQFEGDRRDAVYGVLRQRVGMIVEAGLSVVVDFQPVKQNPDYAPKGFVQGPETELFAAYCGMLERAARLLSDFPSGHVALELMNEPDIGWSSAADSRWQAIIEKAYRQSRAVAPDLPLILTGDRGGGVEGLVLLDPTPFLADQRVLFSFHYYTPLEFTHQTYPAVPYLRVLADVPYPSDARGLLEGIEAADDWIAKGKEPALIQMRDRILALRYLIPYHIGGFDQGQIHQAFDSVADWTRRYGLRADRIFLGEFGVIRRYGKYHGARDSERLAWLRDVRSEAEAKGYRWSVWEYRDYAGFGIVVDDGTDEIDQETLQALSLR